MHRAEQIVEAAVALIEAETDVAAAVFAHRTLTLSADDQELPAFSVGSGADSPFTEWDVLNQSEIHSNLDLRITASALESTEQDLAAQLARMRAVAHRAVMAGTRTLGLDFVVDVAYGGAEAASMNAGAEKISGSQVFMFTVHYTMDITDPE